MCVQESKRGYLPIVDECGSLCALTTRTDLKKNRDFPAASKDARGTLLVGAAVKAGVEDVVDMRRIERLYEAGANIIVLDSQNGDCSIQIEYLKAIKVCAIEYSFIAACIFIKSTVTHSQIH